MPETRAERYEIDGGARLTGTVTVTGAKNSVLKLMAAALLAQGTTVIRAVPDILDVEIMAELLRRLGCHVVVDAAAGTVVIDVPEQLAHKADYDLVRRMRASICVLGPLIARCGRADVERNDTSGRYRSHGCRRHDPGCHRAGVARIFHSGNRVSSRI